MGKGGRGSGGASPSLTKASQKTQTIPRLTRSENWNKNNAHTTQRAGHKLNRKAGGTFMAKASSQKFIARNRAPRVQIEYDVEPYGAETKVDLPFAMAVMA